MLEGGGGIKIGLTATTSSTSALGNQDVNNVPVPRLRNSCGAPPPGFSRMTSATPPQMNPVVRVATTSGIRDVITIRPFNAPMTAAATRTATATSKDCPKLAFSMPPAATT